MYNNVKVLDVHAHLSVPQTANTLALGMMASNTPVPSPLGSKKPIYSFIPPVSEEAFRASADAHVAYIDERHIDVQILGPRPFMQLGWMEPHLIEPWTEYVNDMIHQQCEFHPTRFLGACQLPQRWDLPDTSHCL